MWKKVGIGNQWVLLGFLLLITPTEMSPALQLDHFVSSNRQLNRLTTRQTPDNIGDSENVCYTLECNQTASRLLSNMDPNEDPCNDFYLHACGGFITKTVIPDNRDSIDFFSLSGDNMRGALRKTIETENQPNDPRAFQLLKTLYKACMNTAVRNSKGLEPLRLILRKLGGWPVLEGESWNENAFDWMKVTGDIADMGFPNYLIGFDIHKDLLNSTQRVIALDGPGVGYYFSRLSRDFFRHIVNTYDNYMIEIATFLGAEKSYAKKELEISLNLEVNLITGAQFGGNMSLRHNPMTIGQLSEKYPSIPWRYYFRRILPSSINFDDNEIVNVVDPDYLVRLNRLISETPKRVIANYLLWRVTQDSIRFLDDDIRKKELAYATTLTGLTRHPDQWEECLNVINQYMPIATGAIYARNHFSAEKKKNISEMADLIREQLVTILQRVDWMDSKTREYALEKAAAMVKYIAYPDELLDNAKLDEYYKLLEVSETDYFNGILNASKLNNNHKFSKLREQPVNRTDWRDHANVATADAFYDVMANGIVLPAGVFHDSVFNKDRPQYVNFGRVGFIVGHEMTHGFDIVGRQIDKHGNVLNWWTPEAERNYLTRADCIVDQYGNYTVAALGANVDGWFTESENIADNSGIKIAYHAYNTWLANNGPEKTLPGINKTPKQLFWLSYANFWCGKYKESFLHTYMNTDPHSPNPFRVLGPLSNMPEFAQDYDCPYGSDMNPVHKCLMW